MDKSLIGCSGYYYKHWIGIFYPTDMPKYKWLPYYAEHFDTVEINSSFYHMPQDNAVLNWYKITPPNFVFTLKGNRFITHLKKLHIDTALIDTVHQFQQKALLMKEKLGCILWQLPASEGLNLLKLEAFCNILDKDLKHVFEFRHNSWFVKEVFALLNHFNFTICMLSAPGNIPELLLTTSDTAYIRFHGKNGWYNDNYSNEQLDTWGENIRKLNVETAYAYFNNDFHGFAVQNGKYLREVLSRQYQV